MYVIVKIIVSALVIGIVTELARRFPTYGGIVAALPLVSLLSIIWLSVQGESKATLSKFALGVLSGFPATAVLLIVVFLLLKHSISLYVSIGLGIAAWLLFIVLQEAFLKHFNISMFS
ncbi:DUF3147 family protein [Bacillus sp. Bva_UNVM-123]|uniref:DUF3147 family protein n=1 Tax=Bacillus sp. Bva_UNVM-123 TaxID=2829798 RepID=UPI00391FCA3D